MTFSATSQPITSTLPITRPQEALPADPTTSESAPLPAIDAFDPITLERLDARAALQTRRDRKHLLTLDQAQELLYALLTRTPRPQVLEIEGRRRMGYSSIYFDTDDLLSYHQAARRRRRRVKVRTRAYRDTGAAFLETKTTGARGQTVKHRLPHPMGQLTELTGEDMPAVEEALAAVGADVGRAAELAPRLATHYRRTTLLLPGADGDARLTLDLDLQWDLLDDAGAAEGDAPAALQAAGRVVVETKSPGAAGDADRLLRRLGVRPARISKYCTGLAALRPELPSSRWTRTLRRHVTAA